jgi:uncharacterized protein DUF6602
MPLTIYRLHSRHSPRVRAILNMDSMPQHTDAAQLDLNEVFARAQTELLAQLEVGRSFGHAPTHGDATERLWIDLLHRYLPQRYCAAPAFVIDSRGHRSRQIDVAIFDHHASAPLFPHSSGVHIAAETVYAVFEIKPMVNPHGIRDASEKAASVRALYRTSVRPKRILAGLLANGSAWRPEAYSEHVRATISRLPALQRLDLGCSLQHGAFERYRTVRVSPPEQALAFFVLRLLERLRDLGPAPALDLSAYSHSLK